MSELIIPIPPSFSDNFGQPIDFIIKCVAEINTRKPASIKVDFSKCKFTTPFIIGGVVSLMETQKEKGVEVEYAFNEDNQNLKSYIDTICFPEGFDYRSYKNEELDEILLPYQEKTYIPLFLFPTSIQESETKLREKILSTVNSIFKKQLNLSGKILQAIYYLVDELSQNIVDHSGSEKGIVFAQYYPTKNYMDICISDYGKGLLQSYVDSGKHNPSSDEEAINFAVFGKSTKDLPESRGFGISSSRKMLVEGLKGKFFIFSGTSFFYQNVEKEELISLPDIVSFSGCFVALRVPILDNDNFNFYKYVD